ncbi:MAG TPA: hypothetical protein VMU39_17235 [Solirubrobacteraceae bacterium]|nr:hypothetical protein [Solirubrobacteraceae bacterium]
MEAKTVPDSPAGAAEATGRGAGSGGPHAARPAADLLGYLSRWPFLTASIACFVVAALSAAVLPTVPSYDPWSWIVWGRAVFDPHLSFSVGGGPSWKPLPVMFTTIFGLFGGAAPTLWVITARAGGLLGVVAAYRLGAQLARRVSPGLTWGPAVAGVIAAIGIVLTQEWAYYMYRGTSEPMLIACSLWAIDRHLAARYTPAFLLGVGAALIRPEAWPFIFVYAIWLWRREPRMRVLLVAGLFAIPFLWFVPPWIGSGQPFLAASHAKAYNGHLGKHKLLEVLRRGGDLQVLPMLVLALAGVALCWWRDRDRLIVGLAGAAAAWWVLVVAMTLDGYPGLERFYLPAAGLTCVLAGVGVVRIARAASDAAASRPRLAAHASLAGIGVVVLLVVLSISLTSSRINEARAQNAIANRAVTRLDQLSAAVAAVGGRSAVYPCRSSFAAVNHGVQTALAWKLHVTLGRVGTSMRHRGVLFVGPHDSIDGGPAAIDPRLTRHQLLATVGAWKVYRVWRDGHLSACVGR